jgi:DNA-binding XRE family transcriptional regulator
MTRKVSPINPKRRTWMEEKRAEMNLSTRKIAPVIGGISWQHYGDIEAGRKNPSIPLSYKLADFFGVDVSMFLENRTKFKVEENG